MIIKQIEFSGFRGFASHTQIPVASGFTVICGPNGSGKSTICDAVEFALTGSIGRFRDATEKRERVSDYIWWRGARAVSDRRITITYGDATGNDFDVMASPGKMQEIRLDRFVDIDLAPENPLTELCLGMILRDDTLTDYSTDMPETERTDFITRMMGLTELSVFDRRLDGLVQTLNDEYKLRSSAAIELTDRLSELRVRVTTLQTSIDRVGELPDTMHLKSKVEEITQESIADSKSLIPFTREAIARRRQLLLTLERYLTQFGDQGDLPNGGTASSLENEKTTLSKQLADIRDRVREANADLESVRDDLKATREAIRGSESLVRLREIGAQIGLQRGKCPLCGSNIAESDFQRHLTEITSNAGLDDRRHRDLISREAELAKTISNLTELENDLVKRIAAITVAVENVRDIKAEIEGLGHFVDHPVTPVSVRSGLDRVRHEVNRLTTLLGQMEASEGLKELEDYTAQQRSLEPLVSKRTRSLQSCQRALEGAKSAQSTVDRLRGQLVRDNLILIRPLFLELYARLRPHPDFLDVNYQIRGDVRHFLSLLVGGEVNPRFVFSSGQRRLLGLAFLLAVAMSRRWTRLQTIMLDDPVQHVDDYRALQVVEVLSALRRTGQQIICTVEDEALADLLCRRLVGRGHGEGLKIKLCYKPGEGAGVESISRIIPNPSHVLISA